MQINLMYAFSITFIFILLKFLMNYPKKEEMKNVIKDGCLVFGSSLTGIFLINKFGTFENKIMKSTQVFTDNAGF
jgi:uncharacterized membrane protein